MGDTCRVAVCHPMAGTVWVDRTRDGAPGRLPGPLTLRDSVSQFLATPSKALSPRWAAGEPDPGPQLPHHLPHGPRVKAPRAGRHPLRCVSPEDGALGLPLYF